MKFEEQLKQDCKEIKEITHYLDKSYLKVQMESIHNGPISRIPPEIYVSQLDGLFNDFDYPIAKNILIAYFKSMSKLLIDDSFPIKNGIIPSVDKDMTVKDYAQIIFEN